MDEVFGVGGGSPVAEGWMKAAAGDHPVTAGLRSSLHVFGGYVMTEFKRLLAGGENEGAAIVPGHAEQSSLLKMVTPKDGEIRMPKGKTPLVDFCQQEPDAVLDIKHKGPPWIMSLYI